MDRAHRIGQKKVVNVYRLITRGTLEEKIMGYVIKMFNFIKKKKVFEFSILQFLMFFNCYDRNPLPMSFVAAKVFFLVNTQLII